MTDLSRFLGGGAAGRPDSITGLSPDMQNALMALFAEAPEGYLTINSGYRSPELQARLFQDALARYGSEDEARRWVAPPGRSQHNHGMAVDLGFASPEAQAWAHQNAERFGLAFPLSNEAWHIELAGARDGHAGHQAPAQPPQGQPQGVEPRAPQNALAGLSAPRRNPFENIMLNPADFMMANDFGQWRG